MARLVARLTAAAATPGWRPSARSTRAAHEPQDMPVTANSHTPAGASGPGAADPAAPDTAGPAAVPATVKWW